jgi:hypothetical protein
MVLRAGPKGMTSRIVKIEKSTGQYPDVCNNLLLIEYFFHLVP